MKCLYKYQWVKLQRNYLPEGKGILGYWAKLAACAAYRKGTALYCGYENAVSPGMWSGGVTGIKSILGVKSRSMALQVLQELSELGYLTYHLDPKTKKLTLQIADWVMNCTGADCMNGAVYATTGYGFLCMPRKITERLVKAGRLFEEADVWMDLWCHTVSADPSNVFSGMAPVVQYGKYGIVLTLEKLGQRWGWEKTKVWRFFKKHEDTFSLYRLPGSYGCLVFNQMYPSEKEILLPDQADIVRILDEIRIMGVNAHKKGTDHEHINRLVAWYGKKLAGKDTNQEDENRVAHFNPLTRAYLSQCRNCENCNYDCQSSIYVKLLTESNKGHIRGPCKTVDLSKIAKEIVEYEYAG